MLNTLCRETCAQAGDVARVVAMLCEDRTNRDSLTCVARAIGIEVAYVI